MFGLSEHKQFTSGMNLLPKFKYTYQIWIVFVKVTNNLYCNEILMRQNKYSYVTIF